MFTYLDGQGQAIKLSGAHFFDPPFPSTRSLAVYRRKERVKGRRHA